MRLWSGGVPKLPLGTYSPHLPFNTLKLDRAQQRYHAMVIGKSGKGKSKLLEAIAIAYIQNSLRSPAPTGGYSRHGVSVLDPHHDLAFDIIRRLAASGFYRRSDAYQRVVYLDFGRDYYTPLNVLEHNGDSHKWAEQLHNAMVRVWPELEDSPTFSEYFQAGVVVLMENKLPITYLHRLFTDPSFRRHCTARLGDDEVVWNSFVRFESLGPRDQEQVAGATIRRAFQLVFHPDTKLCLGQSENRLPLRRFIDEGRFLILNLGGVTGEARKILGALLMVQLEQAALSRIDVLDQQDRVQHTAIVDEWPTFSATEKTLSEILSQTRKFGLNIYLACQDLGQISAKRLSSAFANCSLGIYFALGHESAEASAKQIGDLDPFVVKEARSEFSSDADARSPIEHNQYMPLLEQIQVWTNELKRLSQRYCYVNVDGAQAIKIRTSSAPRVTTDQDYLESILSTYRQLYQSSRAQAEQNLKASEPSGLTSRDDAAYVPVENALDWS